MAMPTDDIGARPSRPAVISWLGADKGAVSGTSLVSSIASELELPESGEPGDAGKKSALGWMPAQFRSDRRNGESAEYVHLLVVDYDNAEPDWSALEGLDYQAHTTHSHLTVTKKYPAGDARCWRLIVTLAEPIAAKDWDGKYLLSLFPGADNAASDACRFFYCPPVGAEYRRHRGAAFVPPPKPPKPAPAPWTPPTAEQGASRWALAALDSACREMAAATEPGRHEVWFRQHAAMAEIVAGGALTEHAVIAALEDAARVAFGDQFESRMGEDLRRTRTDAWQKGLQHPRRAPASNVRQFPSRGLKPAQPLDADPGVLDTEHDEEQPEREIPPPRARVPFTARRYQPKSRTAALADVVPHLDPKGHEHLDDYAIAGLIIRASERRGRPLYFPGKIGGTDQTLLVYESGAFLDVDAYALAADCAGQLHGATTKGVALKIARATQDGNEADARNWASKCYTASVASKKCVATQVVDQLFTARAATGDEEGMLANSAPGAVFTNGTIVRRHDGTWTLEAHSPDHKQRHGFPFAYEPGLVPKHAQQVFRDWFRDCSEAEQEARICVLRAAGGVALLGAYELVRRSPWLYGVRGHDGKGTYQAILDALAPQGSAVRCSPADASRVVTGGDALASLEHARLNIVEEAGDKLESLEKIKSALVCEPIKIRAIGEKHRDIRPKCIWVLASNELPAIPPAHASAWERRIVPVRFSAPLQEHEVDRELVPKLLGLEARDIVCWFIDAALEMLERGGRYTLPACASEVFNEWRATSSPLEQFAAELPTMGRAPAQQGWPTVEALWTAYLAWLDERRLKVERPACSAFSREIRRVLGARAKWAKRGGTARYWIDSASTVSASAEVPARRSMPPAELLDLVKSLPTTTRAVWANGGWQANPSYREPAPKSEPHALKPAEPLDDIRFDNEPAAAEQDEPDKFSAFAE